jgi:hypothetical protein
VRGENGAADRESQPEAAVFRGDKRVEDALEQIAFNAFAAI